MVGYSSSTSVTIHIILAPPTDFPLGNSGGLSKKIGYMGNVRRPSEPQVMTKFWCATNDLLKVNFRHNKALIQGIE
jgi:hypothetical protein